MSINLIRVLVVSLACAAATGHIATLGPNSACGQETGATNQAHSVSADSKKIDGLSALLTGSLWTGQFTKIDAKGTTGAIKKETYEISNAEKLPDGNLWMLTARIKYGDRDVTVPLPIDILWAGDTPVITVDQLLIPGLGTFDARVLIRDNKYSGTWTHNDHGGHLFGTIGKMKELTSEE